MRAHGIPAPRGRFVVPPPEDSDGRTSPGDPGGSRGIDRRTARRPPANGDASGWCPPPPRGLLTVGAGRCSAAARNDGDPR